MDITLAHCGTLNLEELIDRAFVRARDDKKNLLVNAKGKALNTDDIQELYQQYPHIREIVGSLERAKQCEDCVYKGFTDVHSALKKITSKRDRKIDLAQGQRLIEQALARLSTLANDEYQVISAFPIDGGAADTPFKSIMHVPQTISELKQFRKAIKHIIETQKNYLEDLEFLNLESYSQAQEQAKLFFSSIEDDNTDSVTGTLDKHELRLQQLAHLLQAFILEQACLKQNRGVSDRLQKLHDRFEGQHIDEDSFRTRLIHVDAVFESDARDRFFNHSVIENFTRKHSQLLRKLGFDDLTPKVPEAQLIDISAEI